MEQVGIVKTAQEWIDQFQDTLLPLTRTEYDNANYDTTTLETVYAALKRRNDNAASNQIAHNAATHTVHLAAMALPTKSEQKTQDDILTRLQALLAANSTLAAPPRYPPRDQRQNQRPTNPLAVFIDLTPHPAVTESHLRALLRDDRLPTLKGITIRANDRDGQPVRTAIMRFSTPDEPARLTAEPVQVAQLNIFLKPELSYAVRENKRYVRRYSFLVQNQNSLLPHTASPCPVMGLVDTGCSESIVPNTSIIQSRATVKPIAFEGLGGATVLTTGITGRAETETGLTLSSTVHHPLHRPSHLSA